MEFDCVFLVNFINSIGVCYFGCRPAASAVLVQGSIVEVHAAF